MDRHHRLPLVLLAAVVVLALLTGVAAAVAGRDDEGAGSSPEVEVTAADPLALRVLRAWDSRRARAYARADEAALAALYVDDSRTGAADLSVLRAYRQRGLRVVQLRTRVLEASVLHETSARLVVRVTDMLLDAVAGDRHDHRWTLPRDGPTTRAVVLVRADGDWLVDEVYPVD